MKKLLIVSALMLSACTPSQIMQSAPIIGNVCSAANGTLIDEKVIYAAEVLYNIPGDAYRTANENGQITPELKAVLKPKLIALGNLLTTIRAAKGTVNCDYNAMKDLHSQIIQLLPR